MVDSYFKYIVYIIVIFVSYILKIVQSVTLCCCTSLKISVISDTKKLV